MFPASFQLVVVDFFKLYQCSHLSRNIGSPRFFVLPQSAGGWTFLSLVQDGLFYLWCSNILHFLHNTFIQSFIPWKFSKWIGLALSSGRLSQCMASFPAKVAVSYLADALEAALVINKSYQLVCLCYWTGRDISTHTHTPQRLYRQVRNGGLVLEFTLTIRGQKRSVKILQSLLQGLSWCCQLLRGLI